MFGCILKKTESFRTKERQRAGSACLKSLVRADGHTHASDHAQTTQSIGTKERKKSVAVFRQVWVGPGSRDLGNGIARYPTP